MKIAYTPAYQLTLHVISMPQGVNLGVSSIQMTPDGCECLTPQLSI
jgi:hypothetical protein